MTTPPKKVLVVEDEKPIARPLALKLKFFGFDAKIAYDGEEALSILKNEKFDLILLDLVMPKVDGFSVLLELKARGDQTPVIVASNLSQEEDIKRAMDLGVKGYYIKANASLDEIVENVKKVLGV